MLRTSIRYCLLAGSLIGFCLPTDDAQAIPVQIGPNAVSTGSIDSGTPTNVDRNVTQSLLANDYDVTDFNVAVTGADGVRAVVPFLATGAPSNYTVIWVGPSFMPTTNGVHNVSYLQGTQQFTLASTQTVFAGTDSDIGPLVDFAGGGSTDHDGSPGFGTIFVGQNLTGFSNPGLGRTYSFNLIVDETPLAVPEPSTWLLLSAGLVGLAIHTRRRSARWSSPTVRSEV